jgi:hypothetical protein
VLGAYKTKEGNKEAKNLENKMFLQDILKECVTRISYITFNIGNNGITELRSNHKLRPHCIGGRGKGI